MLAFFTTFIVKKNLNGFFFLSYKSIVRKAFSPKRNVHVRTRFYYHMICASNYYYLFSKSMQTQKTHAIGSNCFSGVIHQSISNEITQTRGTMNARCTLTFSHVSVDFIFILFAMCHTQISVNFK